MDDFEQIYNKILGDIPSEIDFGFIPVKNEASKTFQIDNISRHNIPLFISSNDVFKFNIEKGVIPKMQKFELKISAFPQNAIVSVGNARIIVGEEKDRKFKIIKMSYISKYPYLKIQKHTLDFGNVLIGKTVENEIIIVNPEKVPANFLIKRKKLTEAKSVEEFFVSDLSGMIPPNSQFLVKVKFNTNFANHFAYETFEILTKGGNTLRFSCIANSLGIRTNINEKFINFQSVELNSLKTKMIRLFNESSEPTSFQFFYNNEGVFQLDELQGIIPANSNVRIRITFRPIETVMYYDRIFCITKNHFLFAIDVCGSCHDLLTKTKIISQRHIDIIRFKLSSGFFTYSKMGLNSGKDFNITNYFENASKSLKKLSLTRDQKSNEDELFVDSSTQIQLHKELLWENTSNTRIVSSNVDMIDFRYCENGKLSEPFNLTLFNNSNEKIKIKWLLNKPILTSNLTKFYNLFNLENIIFIVNPEEAVINRKSSMEFKVFFKPNCTEQYFYSNLSCLATLQTAYEKKLDSTKGFESDNTKNENKLNMKLQSTKTFTTMAYRTSLLKNLEKNEKGFDYFDPPFPLKINVIGHSFPPSTQIFMPMIELNPSKELIFKPSTIKQSVYQTVSIKNNSDTPLYYKFMTDVSNVFRVYPKLGLIDPKSFNLILVEFSPKEIKSYVFPLKVVFNHDLHSMHMLLLYGLCCDPEIEIENGLNDEIYFSPSFVGISTVKSFNIINKSPIKINIQISTQNDNNFGANNKNIFVSTSNMNFNSINSGNNNTLNNTYAINSNVVLKEGESENGFSQRKNKNQKPSKLALINYKDNLANANKNINGGLISSVRKGENDLNDNVYNSIPNSQINSMQTCLVNVSPNYFEMEPNQITKLDISFAPLIVGNIEKRIEIISSRLYDPIQEMQGIFNPGYISQLQNNFNSKFDKRPFKKVLKVIGKGNDGDLRIEPALLDFGTVKVGFEKKLKFSIFNPTICNFYVKLELENKAEYEKILKLDFREGLIDSLCKKDVNLTFLPNNRASFEMKIKLYASGNKNEKTSKDFNNREADQERKSQKAEIVVKANGDYPLLKICDVRNTNIGMSHLWESFNVDLANEELLKQLTEEEINFINNERTNIKLQDYYEKLKCIKFDFGKHLLKRGNPNNTHTKNLPHLVDIFITLKNVGGVPSEFFFKFPHDISIKREPWMEEVQTTSNETKEYQILKNNLFDIYPRQGKLEANEFCNIRLRYDVKQVGEHRLRVIFQIINGKPLVFELYAETHNERKGILEIRNRNLDFLYAPMGYMMPIVCPLEIKNVGGIKLRYSILEEEIKKYNTINDDFPVFKLENIEGSLSPGETSYIIGSFRPLTNKHYRVVVPILYTDNLTGEQEDHIVLSGYGYNPRLVSIPEVESKFKNMPKSLVYNFFEGNMVQKCGLSVEELDFGLMDKSKTSSQIFILYNYSLNDQFIYEYTIPGFNMTDEFVLEPSKGKLEPNSHVIIKAKLKPSSALSSYNGQIQCVVSWIVQGDTKNVSSKENLYVRVNKKAKLRELPGKIEQSINPNISFLEETMIDCIQEILCDEDFDNLLSTRLDNSPLGLYEWTTNMNFPTQQEVRAKIMANYLSKANTNQLELNNLSVTNSKRNYLNTRGNTSSQQSEKSKDEAGKRISDVLLDNVFNDNEDMKIEDKYVQEIIGKNCYSNMEVNEKMILVNSESRNLINMILESTFNNIIAEAIFGETDLTEQTKIFFLKK